MRGQDVELLNQNNTFSLIREYITNTKSIILLSPVAQLSLFVHLILIGFNRSNNRLRINDTLNLVRRRAIVEKGGVRVPVHMNTGATSTASYRSSSHRRSVRRNLRSCLLVEG